MFIFSHSYSLLTPKISIYGNFPSKNTIFCLTEITQFYIIVKRKLYNSNKSYQSKALNYFHLFIAAITAIYFAASFFMEPTVVNPEMLKAQKYSRYFLLLCIVIDLLLAVYIKVAEFKPILFFQSLSAMLLLSAHLAFIYSYFAFDNGAITSQSSIDIGIILLIVSALLHLANFWHPKEVHVDSYKIDVDDSLFEMRNYDDE